jgi:hypothetical protein
VPVCLLQIRKFFTIGQKGWNNSFKVFGLFSALLWQNQQEFSGLFFFPCPLSQIKSRAFEANIYKERNDVFADF